MTRYIRSVEGHAVPNWSLQMRGMQTQLLGARITSMVERKEGAPNIVWNTDEVIALSDDFCRRYGRELRGAIARGELKEVKPAAYKKWQKKLEEREAELKKQADQRAKSQTTAQAEADNNDEQADSNESGTPNSEDAT